MPGKCRIRNLKHDNFQVTLYKVTYFSGERVGKYFPDWLPITVESATVF